MSSAAIGSVQTVPEVCPYCGSGAFSGVRCQQCRGLSDPLSLQASQNDMGPWFVRTESAPFRPGCSYRLLVQQVLKGRITSDTIVRGPTTRQFWMKAARTPGISHLLGVCHSCGTHVEPESECCPACHASFVVEAPRQHLGLGPVYLVPGQTGGDDVVVAGKKLPPLVADSVDLEPLFIDEPALIRPMPRETTKSAVSLSELPVAKSSNGFAIACLVWAILATLAAGILAADVWLDMGIVIQHPNKFPPNA